jgi:glycosyltransferase involved in cell wall biosynthesis
MQGLSILIPVYCDSCVEQVRLLCRQCRGLQMPWEIIVADDGSTSGMASLNDEIEAMDGCRLIKYPENIGRAGIRNFLAHQAHYDTLLYIDAGMMPSERFIDTYVRHIGKADVVVGSIRVAKEHINLTNLRCKNELRAEHRTSVEKANASPYTNFHSGNFMVHRQTMLDNPFRGEILTYGYEDTLFGKALADKHISILHIDNPLYFVRFESNERFLEKTKEAMLTLYTYREELQGYSGVLRLVTRLQHWHLLWITVWISRFTRRLISHNLIGNHPFIPFYHLYRIMCLARHFHE